MTSRLKRWVVLVDPPLSLPTVMKPMALTRQFRLTAAAADDHHGVRHAQEREVAKEIGIQSDLIGLDAAPRLGSIELALTISLIAPQEPAKISYGRRPKRNVAAPP